MCSIIINGEEAGIRSDGLARVCELIELVKTSIDPDHMITGILLDGREMEDGDWEAALNQYETSIFEIETGTPDSFVKIRLANSAGVIQSCYMLFRETRKCFQEGRMQDGNQQLLQAVNTLQAFFEWYGTLLELTEESQRAQFDITTQVDAIGEICQKICQQQLYQSWWALGETLQNELEPKLDGLENFCRKFAE